VTNCTDIARVMLASRVIATGPPIRTVCVCVCVCVNLDSHRTQDPIHLRLPRDCPPPHEYPDDALLFTRTAGSDEASLAFGNKGRAESVRRSQHV
jgi:hypothetical protein